MMLLAVLLVAWTTSDPMWSKEVAVMHGSDAVVRFQARLEDNYLIVKATHKKGWHTYAMDNEARSLRALQGKKSLGIEQGISIQVDDGLELDGSWLQSTPLDMSKPELRWFTYGFDESAWFACRVKEASSDQVTLRIRGQACSGETCCNVDIKLKLLAGNRPIDTKEQAQASPLKEVLKDLVPVEIQDASTPE